MQTQAQGKYFGPPPQSGDPLPYPSQPSEGDGLPYGSDIGGCRTYGDIQYVKNSWLEAPMEKANSLIATVLTPVAAAATSSSRTAIQARPSRERWRLVAATTPTMTRITIRT